MTIRRLTRTTRLTLLRREVTMRAMRRLLAVALVSRLLF